MNELLLAFDLGGTNLRAGLVDRNGAILARARTATGRKPRPETVAAKMADLAGECLKQVPGRARILCAGIGSPGPLNTRTGIIGLSPNLGWRDVPLASLAATQLRLPVYLENDAVAAAWGEFWKGAGVGFRSMFIFTLGTGVGGGLILDGRVWRGPDDTAGHLGHMIVDPDGPIQELANNPGSVEACCSATACVREARAAAQRHPESLLAGVPPEKLTGAFVSACAAKGDPWAREILRRIGSCLGLACASLANALNPELGVIGGGLGQAGEFILGPCREECLRRALPLPGRRLKILPALLGDDAGLVGAAGLAWERMRDGEIAVTHPRLRPEEERTERSAATPG